MSNTHGVKFKETVLPPGFFDKPGEVQAVTASAPEVKPVDAAARNAARSDTAASGSETWNRSVRPRHRTAVKNYFSESKK
jgi:hypothetical protein